MEQPGRAGRIRRRGLGIAPGWKRRKVPTCSTSTGWPLTSFGSISPCGIWFSGYLMRTRNLTAMTPVCLPPESFSPMPTPTRLVSGAGLVEAESALKVAPARNDCAGCMRRCAALVFAARSPAKLPAAKLVKTIGAPAAPDFFAPDFFAPAFFFATPVFLVDFLVTI